MKSRQARVGVEILIEDAGIGLVRGQRIGLDVLEGDALQRPVRGLHIVPGGAVPGQFHRLHGHRHGVDEGLRITSEPISPHPRAVHGSTGRASHSERAPGDALRPLPASYRRREPEKTALHTLVRRHWETLLAQARQASADGSGYPAFVEKEFRRYLDCGILANGFARL